MDELRYDELAEYLRFITLQNNLSICISDFTGFLPPYGDNSILFPYLLHSNPYCMLIKSNKKLFSKCLKCKNSMSKKPISKNIFYGTCFAGVEEYIVPVIYQNCMIAAISCGVYRTNEAFANRITKRIARDYKIDEELLARTYNTALNPAMTSEETVNALLAIVARYLENIYESMLRHNTLELPSKTKYNASADHILSHSLQYIHDNYCESIRVSEIADFCHCSESYINHLFKTRVKVNINSYINKLRIEESKKLLLDFNMSIKEIALTLGFNDTNYFSKVFKDSCGESATKWRKNAL